MFIQLLIIIQCVVCILGSEKLVIDSDAGADDAVAILLIFSAWDNKDSEFETVAITCVNGNTGQDNVQTNILKTLTIANKPNIPVYAGAHSPLMSNTSAGYFFGRDGFGDFEFEEEIVAEVDKSKYAAVALIELAKKYPGELNVLCLGPLTNIALAVALDPSFIENVKKFYIMGGSVAGIGNVSPGVEFNTMMDPDSKFIVFNCTRDFTKYEVNLLVPWEAILDASITMDWRQSVLGAIDSRAMNFLNQAERISMSNSGDYWGSADAFTAAVMMWPHVITRSVITNVTPVIDGAARGTVLVDYSYLSGKPNNTEVTQSLAQEEIQMKFLKHFSKNNYNKKETMNTLRWKN